MANRAIPMFHVPDVAATADWYRSIGFSVTDTGNDGRDMVWARLAWGEGQVMLSSGGRPSEAARREVDLYVEVDDLANVRRALPDRVEIVEDVHDTFYGMREFIVRDLNRFWITFGEPMPGGSGNLQAGESS